MREQFSDAVDLYEGTGSQPRLEFQGDVASCLTFGVTSALEALAARAGKPAQYSPRWLWHFRSMVPNTVPGYLSLINLAGLCQEKFYPYDLATLEQPPESPAFDDAEASDLKVFSRLIAGQTEIKRSLSRGHSLITIRTLPGGDEHCECVIGFNALGIKVHGSGNTIQWWPWDTLPEFTQVHELSCEQFPPVAVDGYVPAEAATFVGGVLTVPDIVFRWPMIKAEQRASGVVFHFGSDDFTVTWNDENCQPEATYNASSDVLHLPRLDLLIDGIRQSFANVVLRNAKLVQQ